jgi:hypothetical protein
MERELAESVRVTHAHTIHPPRSIQNVRRRGATESSYGREGRARCVTCACRPGCKGRALRLRRRPRPLTSALQRPRSTHRVRALCLPQAPCWHVPSQAAPPHAISTKPKEFWQLLQMTMRQKKCTSLRHQQQPLLCRRHQRTLGCCSGNR